MSGLSHFNCELLPDANTDDHLICPICKELMNRPVSLLCGHSRCQECIHQLISNQSGGGREKACAVCREPINEHMLNISIPLSSVISKLNVKCTNVGCSWVGEHGSKERHQETCSFLLLECPNGCPGSHLRDSLERHLEICPQEKVPCKYCTAEVERYILDQHEPTCQEKPGPCPLNCGHNLPRSHVHLHLDECPKRMMKCSVAGCNNFYQLGMENAHNELCQGSHQALLKSQVESLQRAIYDKSQVAVKRELSKRKCHRWTVPKSSIRIPKDISSPLFGFESHTFRCLWKRTSGQNRLFLNAVFGSSPITVQTRFVLLNEDGVMRVFDTKCETLMEDQIIGAKEDLGPIEK